MTLIAEDLLLLLLDDESGSVTTGTDLTPVLGGAALIELALADAVAVEPKTSVWKSAKVKAETDAQLDDPLLRDALATVAAKERTAQDLVGRLGKGLKDDLLARLEQRGMLERQEDKVLGLFPRTRWPAADSSHEDDVRRQLAEVLLQGAEPDERTAGLVALLHAIGRAHKTINGQGISPGEVKKRARQISEGAWAAKAVKDAIDASTAAVVAASSAGAVAATSG